MTVPTAPRTLVAGALAFATPAFPDERGVFRTPFRSSAFAPAIGRPLFPVAQVNFSVSRRGAVRGLHYTATPPGTAKYVYCAHGRALDIVVDLRVGSPTFGRYDAVELDQERCPALYLPLGVGHLFIALEDDTVMNYLLSLEYRPENELALAPFDPQLALPIPEDIDPILSARDRAAPGLAEALDAGLLPDYTACRALEERHRAGW
ncbi:dTDP-4-dehydrorhamnose 3,5-epimerase family protein [Micromonospora sp. NPDC005686]|uniref:dTDP-4-dehydrorhamnose 3,5-epimerase family protein n=1 Tax=unclassified Micromonospora TaxID=2617518 RepID=UPI0036C81889